MFFQDKIKDDTLQKIYSELFRNIKYKELDIFLCGGMSTKKNTSYRDKLRKKIGSKKVNILYPEDLFMEMLNKKQYDLLTMEGVLADNSDLIVLFPESPGSFAELGAFSQNKETAKKLLVFQHNKFKRARSFIAQGPIDYMNRNYKGSVHYFNEDIDKVSNELKTILRKRFKLYSKGSNTIEFKDVDRVTGLLSFSLLLLFFYERMSLPLFEKTLRLMYNNLDLQIDNFNIIYNAAVKLMHKRGLIEKQQQAGKAFYYCLSYDGYIKARMLLNSIELEKRNIIIDEIRLNILRDQIC